MKPGVLSGMMGVPGVSGSSHAHHKGWQPRAQLNQTLALDSDAMLKFCLQVFRSFFSDFPLNKCFRKSASIQNILFLSKISQRMRKWRFHFSSKRNAASCQSRILYHSSSTFQVFMISLGNRNLTAKGCNIKAVSPHFWVTSGFPKYWNPTLHRSSITKADVW